MTLRVIDSFDLLVSYYQIALFDRNLDDHFNDWRPEHIRQGFAWRPRSVSFGTLDILNMLIQVQLADTVHLRSDTVRAIRVPFSVHPGARIDVAVVADKRGVHVPPGEYALTFEHGIDKTGDKMWCTFTFVPDPAAEPAILIADPELSNPPDPLLMEADPA